MQAIKIVVLSVFAAICYVISHDMITAHVCVEYFTVAHPFIFPSFDPVVMAVLWGFIATWWVGLILGIGLAIAAQAGSGPRLGPADVFPGILRVLAFMAVLAAILSAIGFFCSSRHWIWLTEPLSERIPPEKWNAFFFDAFAHTGSYLGGFLGGAILIRATWKKRKELTN